MQQINLYQPIFKRQEKVFSAKTLLQAGLLVVVGLVAVYGYGLWQTVKLDERVEAFEQQRGAALKRLQQVSNQFPAPKRDPALQTRLQQLEKELAGKQRVVKALDSPRFGNRKGFTDRLEAFARQRPQRLWLQHVSLREGGDDIILAGSTYQPEQVPQFVQRLGQEGSLTGFTFRRLLITRSEEEAGRVDFTLRSQPEKKEAAR
ncbi:PilN domain-containing protein [Thiohalomonas denitrificans]|uniref:Tfp pilus assembly protein PilN n=1 Tax=Thiohalomonas denitrificans TaxID=415747 RepID=A0A1G5QSV4_9GAMM|nr:PilN domain-containing protein [Thiohalomonas denitrificans]SCZ64964.1 Tfp pilus assembly protein PilN [Thiohalomonas denitrificans]